MEHHLGEARSHFPEGVHEARIQPAVLDHFQEHLSHVQAGDHCLPGRKAPSIPGHHPCGDTILHDDLLDLGACEDIATGGTESADQAER
jgi:hypothetical protein